MDDDFTVFNRRWCLCLADDAAALSFRYYEGKAQPSFWANTDLMLDLMLVISVSQKRCCCFER